MGDPDSDEGAVVPSSGIDGSTFDSITSGDTAGCACECRRRKKITATAMQIAAKPPTTPPTMAPGFEPEPLPPEDACVGDPVEYG